MTKLQPEDYIKNFSSQKETELYISLVHDKLFWTKFPFTQNFHFVLKMIYMKYFSHPIDSEVERAWQIIKDRWGKVTPVTIMKYLEDKFKNDHLRKFEYAFYAKCLSRLDIKNKTIVDIGGGFGYSVIVPLLFQDIKSKIISIDVTEYPNVSKFPITFIKGDCIDTNLPDSSVDLVSIISTLEHVGLGRYGDPLNTDGDLLAMREAYRILKKRGYIVLTIPYGYPTVVFNLHRIYDSGRFRLLIKGFEPLLLEYSLLGKKAKRSEVEGKKVTKYIPDFYSEIPNDLRHLDPPGGVMALLKKI